jgi:hypothetical protein
MHDSRNCRRQVGRETQKASVLSCNEGAHTLALPRKEDLNRLRQGYTHTISVLLDQT